MSEKSTYSNFFDVVFSQDFYGEIYHSTTMDLTTVMPHMAAAMIAAGLSSHWGDSALSEFFIPVLKSNKPIHAFEEDPHKDMIASANALLLSVNKIGDYFNDEYEENVRFRKQVVKMLERVIPAGLGNL